jgi:hypothetical protein
MTRLFCFPVFAFLSLTALLFRISTYSVLIGWALHVRIWKCIRSGGCRKSEIN